MYVVLIVKGMIKSFRLINYKDNTGIDHSLRNRRDLADMAVPSFSGRRLEDSILHCKNVRVYIACKKLPPRTAVGVVPADAEDNMAEISYFSSTLKKNAALWFNTLTIEVNPAVAVAGNIGSLAALCTAFEAHYRFDRAQKWRYISELFKMKQLPGEKVEEYMRRIKEKGVGCRADDEQVCDSTIAGFLLYIQASVCNNDIETGQQGLITIRKWALGGESVHQAVPVGVDATRLQQQIEELSARLKKHKHV